MNIAKYKATEKRKVQRVTRTLSDPPYALTVDFGLNIYLKCTLTTTKNNKKKIIKFM